jgi:L-lysine exporter family protein LysE/ArgO
MNAAATAALTGWALSLALIVAIGAQNAFVLRQGLRREHVGPVVAVCAVADALLILAGVAGMGQVLGEQPALARVLTLGGALFLSAYGLRALWRAARPGALLAAAGEQPISLKAALLQALAFTLLNPHVYLDTVMLVGSVGAQQPGALRWFFAAGAMAASGMWFSALGYGARFLAPLFLKPRAWQVLDVLIGAVMLLLAGLLWRQVLG